MNINSRQGKERKVSNKKNKQKYARIKYCLQYYPFYEEMYRERCNDIYIHNRRNNIKGSLRRL